MTNKEIFLTSEGYLELEQELNYLKLEKRPKVIAALKEARALGDLSENAEYDAAKDEQRDIEARIEQLENILKNAEVADDEDFKGGKITFGCRVTILDVELNENMEYKIVGSTEANVLKGLISNESPLGMALLGHKKNDVISVETSDGSLQYKVIKVEKG